MIHRAAALAVFLVSSAVCFARSNGINTSTCFGCHTGGQVPNVTLTANPSTFAPGTDVTLTVTIQAINGNNGGIYLRSNGVGTLSVLTGQNTRLINANEIVHSSPKTASGGSVTFQARWTAPAQMGGVDLEVFALSSNANGNSSGDNAGYAKLSLVWGCAGATYYRDMDLDGVGSSQSGTTLNCSTPQGYSTQNGDCNDNNELVYPGRAEACNARDDDCDAQVDEGLSSVTTYKDDDGDGYGRNDLTQTGCGSGSGWASQGNDCDDTLKTTYPGASETCNLRDDDCDGQVDDGARIICGTGWCRRYGPTCDIAQCRPGTPITESCNGLDDDCNGQVDDGETCPAGKACQEAVCVDAPTGGGGGGGNAAVDAGSAPGGNKPATPSGGCDVTGGLAAALALLAFAALRRRR